MGDPYILMLIALGGLAIVDLVVGVSNDAVNFLNSAIGSKAFPLKTIMIIASIGVFFGAISSSGMMEVARKGIFNPNMFVFEEIMYIFMAVMITDILLLDIFNSLGMPTSTTVSIVFELLGAAVAISIIKISGSKTESLADLGNYINQTKALQIIAGILLSVFFAFTIGAIVQYFARLLYTFDFHKKPSYVNVLFGGVAITALTYFILLKGMKGMAFSQQVVELLHTGKEGTLAALNSFFGENFTSLKDALKELKGVVKLDNKSGELGLTLFGYLEHYVFRIVGVSILIWSLVSYLIIKFLKFNILVVVIGLGVFSLALAFSGNDLVNFIGVPMAALNSYESWKSSGVAADQFLMGDLAKKVPSNTYLLLLAGAIMVITLWTSKKSKAVIETEVNLSRQGTGSEKFRPNYISRGIVKMAMTANKAFTSVLSGSAKEYLNTKFEKPIIEISQDKSYEMPAFDLVRAAINLVVASILIAIATSMKLPLSTTYVSFMVAMGTSLADRAWGRDSAVYRVAGVLSVVGGWFLTAIVAFLASAIVVYLITWTKLMIPVLLMVVIWLLVRNSISHAKREKQKAAEKEASRTEIKNINGIINESSEQIAKVAKRVNKLYSTVVDGLEMESISKLSKNEKLVAKLNSDIDTLKEGVFYFIKGLDDSSVKASKFYILTLGYLQDITQSVNYISKSSYVHINNKHQTLKKSQIQDLRSIDSELTDILDAVSISFKEHKFEDLRVVVKEKKELLAEVNKSIEKQISRINKTEESSPKNSTLYFGILLETQDLISAFLDMLEMYDEFHLIAKES